MAVRLPLILSQPSKRHSAATELIENIVAAALLLPRLDANLVGDIDAIEPGGTDHLCLQGHGRDLILASFHALEVAQSAWQRLGLTGAFIDCRLSEAELRRHAQHSIDRRVYYFGLDTSTRISWLLDRCQELVNSQSVQLVNIQLPVVGLSNSVGAGEATKAEANREQRGMPLPVHQPDRKPLVGAQRAVDDHADDEHHDWTSIDRLVDDLDAMDL